MSRLSAGLVLAVLFLACLVASAPARLLGMVLPETAIILQGYGGTIWCGRASQALLATQSGYIHLGAVHWSLKPLSLLTLSPFFEVDSSWGKQRLSGGVRISADDNIELKNLDAAFSAQLLRQFLPLAVGGEFFVQLANLQLHRGLPTAVQGRIVWQHATWESSQGALALGTYALELEQQAGGALKGTIVTIAGGVVANGDASLDGDRYSVNILVTDDAGLDSQLGQALSLIAQPVADGYRIAFEGQLSGPQ